MPVGKALGIMTADLGTAIDSVCLNALRTALDKLGDGAYAPGPTSPARPAPAA